MAGRPKGSLGADGGGRATSPTLVLRLPGTDVKRWRSLVSGRTS